MPWTISAARNKNSRCWMKHQVQQQEGFIGEKLPCRFRHKQFRRKRQAREHRQTRKLPTTNTHHIFTTMNVTASSPVL
ncbi:hypothetical protein GQ600_6443 [Phytophthora cactorum]|nr:hypothetical protein GQ600_6443 [Phytophthora cactorum]